MVSQIEHPPPYRPRKPVQAASATSVREVSTSRRRLAAGSTRPCQRPCRPLAHPVRDPPCTLKAGTSLEPCCFIIIELQVESPPHRLPRPDAKSVPIQVTEPIRPIPDSGVIVCRRTRMHRPAFVLHAFPSLPSGSRPDCTFMRCWPVVRVLAPKLCRRARATPTIGFVWQPLVSRLNVRHVCGPADLPPHVRRLRRQPKPGTL